MHPALPLLLAQTVASPEAAFGTQAAAMPGLDMTRYAAVCLGLVVMILLLGWGFKRFLAGNLRTRAGERSMKVVDVLPLGAKRQLAVVRCYDRTFVLGLGEREVNLVTELDVDEDVEGALPAADPTATAARPPAAGFGGLLEAAMGKLGAGRAAGANPETRPGPRAELRPTPPPAAPTTTAPATTRSATMPPTSGPAPGAGPGEGSSDGPSLGRGILG